MHRDRPQIRAPWVGLGGKTFAGLADRNQTTSSGAPAERLADKCEAPIPVWCKDVYLNSSTSNGTLQFSRSGVYNAERYTLHRGYIPIVSYVHRRPEAFRLTIASLRRLQGIAGTMLVVFFDPSPDRETYIDMVASAVDFCQLIVVRNPPHLAPALACGAVWSLKWTWLNVQRYVFQELFSTLASDVLFIEEDHMVSSVDTYRMLHALSRLKREGRAGNHGLPPVSTISLSTPGGFKQETIFVEGTGVSDVRITQQFSNTGYAFNRSFWAKMWPFVAASSFEDWDWTTYVYLSSMGSANHHLRPAINRILNSGEYCDFATRGLHHSSVVSAKPKCGDALELVSTIDSRSSTSEFNLTDLTVRWQAVSAYPVWYTNNFNLSASKEAGAAVVCGRDCIRDAS